MCIIAKAIIRFPLLQEHKSNVTAKNKKTKNNLVLCCRFWNCKGIPCCSYYCTNKIHIQCAHWNKTWNLTDTVTGQLKGSGNTTTDKWLVLPIDRWRSWTDHRLMSNANVQVLKTLWTRGGDFGSGKFTRQVGWKDWLRGNKRDNGCVGRGWSVRGADLKWQMIWLSPEEDSPQTSTPVRREAVHAWSTSAVTDRLLHWWPPKPVKETGKMLSTRKICIKIKIGRQTNPQSE